MSIAQLPARESPVTEDDPAPFSHSWSRWFASVWNALRGGTSGSAVLTKVTPAGQNGQIVVLNGVVTKLSSPT